MKDINYLSVLFFFILFSLNSIDNVLIQESPFPVVNMTENGIQDHSRSHDCSIDGDDLIYRIPHLPLSPAHLSKELLTSYYEILIPGILAAIWQPPKQQISCWLVII